MGTISQGAGGQREAACGFLGGLTQQGGAVIDAHGAASFCGDGDGNDVVVGQRVEGTNRGGGGSEGVKGLDVLCRCDAVVASEILRGTSGDINGDSACFCRIGCNGEGEGGVTQLREDTFGAIANRDVSGGEAGDGF